jgi:hypothetical protein
MLNTLLLLRSRNGRRMDHTTLLFRLFFFSVLLFVLLFGDGYERLNTRLNAVLMWHGWPPLKY